MQAIEPTQPTQPTDDTPTRGPRRRRWATAAAIVLVLLLVALATIGGGSRTNSADGVRRTTADVAGSTSADMPNSDEEAAEDALDAEDNSDEQTDDVELSSGDADGGDQGGVDLEPVGDGDTVDPCAELPAGQGDLLVVPDPLALPSGHMEDEVHIRNCGAGSVDWTAATVPSVSLASSAGTLAPGELTSLGFVIDHDAWDPGAIEFKIKVSEPGHNKYVDVHAYRPLVGAEMVGSNDFSPGPHVGGCAEQCITKALLIRNLTTPNVGLDVATTVPAQVRVYVSTQAPVDNLDGNPWFPGKLPIAVSPDGVQSWLASLSPLQATTKYFIIVKATDDDGDTAYQSGSFWTITPFDGPDGVAPNDPEPGCANYCITKATITPGEGLAASHLSVKSHTPAQFQLRLSTEAPTYQAGVPGFAHSDVWHNSGLNYTYGWELDIEGLESGTTYHGIVQATDANGHKAYAVGLFTTDGVDVLITIHTVHITEDGDSSSYNRGELSFAWGVGDDTTGIRGEHKMDDGDEIGFPGHSTYLVHGAKGFLPTVYVTASERDADGLSEFCSAGDGAMHEPGSDEGCDSKWNVASSGLLSVHGLSSLADCSTVGIGGDMADDPCMVLVSEDLSNGSPEFWAIVSFTLIP